MAEKIKLDPSAVRELRRIDERLVSYNVEFAEVTGGTFWKAYTPAQIAGEEKFEGAPNLANLPDIMQVYPPIDLYNTKLRKLAGALGSVWVRVSGAWATKTYCDFDGTTGGNPPEGYQNVLTKEQWVGVLDFVKDLGAKLLISVANCDGLHSVGEPWNPSEAEKIFSFSRAYGVPVDATEFVNEPNIFELSGCLKGYTVEEYVRDQDLFIAWVRANYPDTLVVGPCNAPGAGIGGIAEKLGNCATVHELIGNAKEKLDVYSYHYYNGISERMASAFPQFYWGSERATSEDYLAYAGQSARANTVYRDQYCPGGQMWVTESGDAAAGGCTWASTYLDVFRTLNELGEFSTITDGVIFHNTLASSDYGYLAPEVFDPRPNYFAVLLWNRLMGTTVYDSGEPVREGAHVYVHSRRDGQAGKAYLVISNSTSEATEAELPGEAEVYMLSAASLRSSIMLCNGKPLIAGENGALPEEALQPVKSVGTLLIPPLTCAFIVV